MVSLWPLPFGLGQTRHHHHHHRNLRGILAQEQSPSKNAVKQCSLAVMQGACGLECNVLVVYCFSRRFTASAGTCDPPFSHRAARAVRHMSVAPSLADCVKSQWEGLENHSGGRGTLSPCCVADNITLTFVLLWVSDTLMVGWRSGVVRHSNRSGLGDLLFLADAGQVTMWKIFFLNLRPCCGVGSFSAAAFNVSSRSLGVSLLGCCFLATGSLDNLVECIACGNSWANRARGCDSKSEGGEGDGCCERVASLRCFAA